jgi:predicted Zn-dependent protease
VSALYLSDVYTRSARAERTTSVKAQLADARSAQRLNPFALAPRYLEAGALEGDRKRAAARAELLDALELEPENFVTMALLGDLETRAGKRAAAREWYERALARNPADVGLQQLAGRTAQ